MASSHVRVGQEEGGGEKRGGLAIRWSEALRVVLYVREMRCCGTGN